MKNQSETNQNFLKELGPHASVPISAGLVKHMKTSSVLVLGVILLLKEQHPDETYITIRQTDIGEFLGFTLMTVSRCYKELRTLGVISCARQGMNPQYQVTVNMPRIAELISSK